MRRWFWLALPGLLALAPLGLTSPTVARKPGPRAVDGHASVFFIVPCNGGGERSCVIASGQGASPLALYVFDAHGNCVARDEPVAARSGDDVAVEWFPATAGVFTIELCNAGPQANAAAVAFR